MAPPEKKKYTMHVVPSLAYGRIMQKAIRSTAVQNSCSQGILGTSAQSILDVTQPHTPLNGAFTL